MFINSTKLQLHALMVHSAISAGYMSSLALHIFFGIDFFLMERLNFDFIYASPLANGTSSYKTGERK